MLFRVFGGLLASGLAAAVLQAAAQTEANRWIVGMITDAATAAPVANATVTITRAGSRPRQAEGADTSVVADAFGRFAFRDVQSGSYAVSADAPGFVAGGYGQKYLDGPLQAITVSAGDAPTVVRADLRLWRSARVAGRLTIDGSRPVPGMTVRAISAVHFQTGASSAGATATTDWDGAYELANLRPGEYVLAVLSTYTTIDSGDRAGSAGDSSNRPSPLKMRIGQAWLTYPSSSFESAWLSDGVLFVRPAIIVPPPSDRGSAISLESGDDRRVDLLWPAESSVTIRGIVTVDDADVAGVEIRANRLYDYATASGRLFDHARTRTAADGTFQMVGMVPGRYQVFASRLGDGRRISWGTAICEIDPGGPRELAVPLRPGLMVRGSIVSAAGDRAIPQRLLANLSVSLTPISGRSTFVPAAEGSVAPSGQFELGPVLPGMYVLEVPEPLPRPWVFERATLGSADGNVLELRADDVTGLTVVLSDAPSSVSVRVDPSGKYNDATVLLFDDDRRRWARAALDVRRFQECVVSPAGGCSFERVPGGTYLVGAVPADRMTSRWRTPRFLEATATSARRVVVEPGSIQQIRLPARE
jgi:hypothetical protein